MNKQVIPVILSGGSGTRLWPLSRSMRPKQFIQLIEQHSLFQQTIKRLEALDNVGAPIVVCNEEHRFMVAEQMQELNIEHDTIILEPVARNTTAAIASAAVNLANRKDGGNQIMLVLPADHLIEGTEAFFDAITNACVFLRKRAIWLLLASLPNKPATGYGYIRSDQSSTTTWQPVQEFVEKPDEETANRLCRKW